MSAAAARREAISRRTEAGIVAVWFAIGIMVFLGFCAFAVDFGNWFWTGNRVQKAADAAALGGVVFMPGNYPEARNVAIGLSHKNGYTDGSGSTVTVVPGTRPTQLRVTVSTVVTNYFTTLFGVDRTTITRTALADFEGPVPMGSPQNYLGNEPVGSGEQRWGNSLPAPQFWLNLAGPGNTKRNGDRFATKWCASPDAGCSGTTNTDYDGNNYYFTIRVDAVVAGKDLNVQVFDPAFVTVGDRCDRNSLDGATTVDVPGVTDESTRYAKGPTNQFCTGDHIVDGPPAASATGVDTTYVMYAPDQTPWNQTDNPVMTSATCSPVTYGSYNGGQGFIANLLRNDTAFQNTFRRWVSVCRVPAGSVTAGDYILQIRTNARPAPNQTQEDPAVQREGHNRFSMRASFTTSGGTAPERGSGCSPCTFAGGRLPIYANADGADTRFHLARIIPGSNNRILRVSLFDVGDASDVGSITILKPDGNPFSSCTWTRSDGAPLSTNGCTLNSVHAGNGYNGKAVDADVTIPGSYNCNATDPVDCWVKIKFEYGPTVQVSDTTTWSARLAGAPVRLIE